MKKLCYIIAVSALALVTMFTGCDKGEKVKEPKVHYIVDGEETSNAPDKNYYKAVSIESNSEEASVVWDVASWSLETSNISGKEVINIYFEKQDKPVTVDGIGFNSLQDAFDYIGTGNKRVYLTKDVEGAGVSAVGSEINIELNGFTIDGKGQDTIINNGTMYIFGSGVITNTVNGEYSKSIVNYGNLTLQGVEVTNTTDSVTVWNSENGSSTLTIKDSNISHIKSSVMTIVNSGSMEIVSGTVTGTGDSFHPTLYNNRGTSVVTLTGGNIANTADGYAIYNESGSVVYGAGTYGDSYNMPAVE